MVEKYVTTKVDFYLRESNDLIHRRSFSIEIICRVDIVFRL